MIDDCPLVSISCITYNHAPYIRQCLDGFMMQQTNFAFEVLIHDDASTDGTTEIIKEYERKYPGIIKPIYEEENQWVKGRRGSAVFNFPRAKGKYIAMCEGDDYWTDPLKLQKQVDFLESHPDYVMCSHQCRKYFQVNKCYEVMTLEGCSLTYDFECLLKGYWHYITLSILFAKSRIDSNYYKYRDRKDASLFFALLKNGKGFYDNHCMGVYRIHADGVWSRMNNENRVISDMINRIEIYKVEQSKASALFLLNLFDRDWGRRLFFKHPILFINVYNVFLKHFGKLFTFRLFYNRIIRNLRFSEIDCCSIGG